MQGVELRLLFPSTLPATSVAGQPRSLHGLLSYLQMLSFVAISRRLIGQAIS